jgi:hypothetical protein
MSVDRRYGVMERAASVRTSHTLYFLERHGRGSAKVRLCEYLQGMH